ncbi:pentapeptide repeat-containing protein [Halarcobacter sp.]|uniref:pentapeptide repeat-containing protein n=1 Tax=Halarcobacter sp. TaxID=2321133 RepID=UPI002AAB9CEA|nr:pentapeptide repeat-containing protein [Halarcobacter sp.]
MSEKKHECKSPNCSRKFDDKELELTGKEDKCILHCEKEKGWIDYLLDDIERISIKNADSRGRYFWEIIEKEKIRNKDYDFSYVIFPYFIDGGIFFDKDASYIFEKEVNFAKAIFMANVNFVNIIFEKKVNFKNVVFVEKVRFDKIYFKSGVDFKHSVFQKKAEFNSLKGAGKLNFEEVIINNKFHIMRLIKDNENIFEINFNDSEFFNNAYIEIYYCDLEVLSFRSILNGADKIVLNRIKINKILQLYDSNFNNLEVLGLDVTNGKCDFFNISIEKASFTNFQLDNYIDKFVYRGNDDRYYTRDIMRQFKSVFDRNGNIIESNRFYALEMKEREKELESDLKKGKNFFEWLIFKIHGISSNHSQDWLLALFWIIVFGFCFSLIKFYMITENDKFIHFHILSFLGIFLLILYGVWLNFISKKEGEIKSFFLLFYLYLVYVYETKDIFLNYFTSVINPFNKFSNMTLIDLLCKIIIAYLIYQLIISIRQNTRRK